MRKPWRHWHLNGVPYARKRDAVAANDGRPVPPCDVDHSVIAVIPLVRLDQIGGKL